MRYAVNAVPSIKIYTTNLNGSKPRFKKYNIGRVILIIPKGPYKDNKYLALSCPREYSFHNTGKESTERNKRVIGPPSRLKICSKYN